MRNLDKFSLEYAKYVNNGIDFKLIYDEYHNISKDMLGSYDYHHDDYIGFDIESLDYYEDWLCGDKRRH